MHFIIINSKWYLTLQVLKYMSTPAEVHRGVEFYSECQYCNSQVRGAGCLVCKRLVFQCSICSLSVRGEPMCIFSEVHNLNLLTGDFFRLLMVRDLFMQTFPFVGPHSKQSEDLILCQRSFDMTQYSKLLNMLCSCMECGFSQRPLSATYMVTCTYLRTEVCTRNILLSVNKQFYY